MVPIIMLAIIISFVNGVLSASIKDPTRCDTYPCLIFQDEFNTLDMKVWEHLVTAVPTGNNEFQYYTNNRSNSFVKDGILFLKPTLTNDTYNDNFLTSGTLDLWGDSINTYCTSNRNSGCLRKGSKEAMINPIQSSAIRTANSFSFKYGKIEVKAKIPRGDWLWPAVWLMPRYSVYGNWPASGEIDLLESRGNDELRNDDINKTLVGNQRVSQSLHWGPYYPLNGHVKTLAHVDKQSGSYADEFHIFALDWDPDGFTFYIDNIETLKINISDNGFWELGNFTLINKNMDNPWRSGTKLAPFDQEFYITMNVAVGGTNQYFHDTYKPKTPWNNDSKWAVAMKDFWDARDQWLPTWNDDATALKVDYVKVWKIS